MTFLAGCHKVLTAHTTPKGSHRMMSTDDETTTPPLTLDEAIARLDAKYELIYVDYRDELRDDQVAMIVRGDTESLWDSLMQFESDARWHGLEYVIGETFTTDEWDALPEDVQDAVRETIQDRDESDVVSGLLSNTSNPLLRITAIDEDDAWSFEPVTAEQVLAKVGLEATEHNVETVQYALDNASPEFSVIMGAWIVSVDLETIYKMPTEDGSVRITNPHLYLGNAFAGSGFITEDALHGTVIVPRDELRTDRDAFGYSVDELYGGLTPSQFTADVEVVTDGND